MVTKPVLQALVLADHIYVDARSGKKVLAGTFNQLGASKFPTQFGRTTYAFICLTEIKGTVKLVLRYVDLRTNHVLMEMQELSVSSDDPLKSVEIVADVPSFPMPHDGAFAFEVHAGGEMIGSLRVSVTKIAEGNER